MLSHLGGIYPIAAGLEILVILAVYGSLAWRRFEFHQRSTVIRYGILFVLAVTAEWWILGSRSFIYFGDDGEAAVPIFLYLARIHDGGQFARGLVGGVDAQGMLGAGTGLFSLEVFLLGHLPPWMAVGLDKIAAATIAFAGSYRVARSMGGGNRTDSFVLAAAYTLSHRYILMVSLLHGMGFALLPLAVYVFVGRLGRPHYLIWVIAVAALNAVSFTPSISGQSLAVCLMVAWLADGARRPVRFGAAVTILAVFALINQAEAVFALLSNAGTSLRGGADLPVTWADFPKLFIQYFRARNPESAVALLASVALLWVFGRRFPARSVAMLAGTLIVAPLLTLAPWERLGLGLLTRVDFTYSMYGFPALLVLVGARAGTAWRAAGAPASWRWLAPSVMVPALVAGQFVWHKLDAATQLLVTGGQSVYQSYSDLARRDWRPDHPFRVATIPYRIDPNTVATYGLESADGIVNIFPGNRGRYWVHALTHANPAYYSGEINIAHQDDMDFLCCRSYDAEKTLDLDALRLINVEYIVSVLPLHGGGLTQVAGAPETVVPPRRGDDMTVKLSGLVKALFQPELHIYRLPGALPRAYVAQGVAEWPSDPDLAAQYRDVVERGLKGVISLTPDSLANLGGGDGLEAGRVAAIRPVRDGYDLDLEMPKGGVVVINAAFVPFWHASADGHPAMLAEANGAQMAVRVAPGTRRLELRYQRPRLTDRLWRGL